MTSAEVRDLLRPHTGGTGSCKITTRRLGDRGRTSFWSGSKHKQLRPRDRALLSCYVQIVLRSGTALRADGIELSDGHFFHPDKAVMRSALRAKLLSLTEKLGTFALTREGWAVVVDSAAVR